jgi:hypothetical protein
MQARSKEVRVRVAFGYLIVALVLPLCACGGAGAKPPCGPNGLPPATLLYPINGATNVPDGNFSMVMSFQYGFVSLAPANGGTPVSVSPTAVPSPLPSPSATPEPGFTPYAVSVTALQSGTTYTVLSSFPNDVDVPCTPVTVKIGSFTTQ